jgi:hypothetical protein
MEKITPSSPEAMLRHGLGESSVQPETGEHRYWHYPLAVGFTNMSQRQEAIASLLRADASHLSEVSKTRK